MKIKLKKLEQKGFAHVEVMLLGILVVAIIGTGLYVYNKNNVSSALSKTTIERAKVKKLIEAATGQKINNSHVTAEGSSVEQGVASKAASSIQASQYGDIKLIQLTIPGYFSGIPGVNIAACSTAHWPNILASAQFWVSDTNPTYRTFLLGDLDQNGKNVPNTSNQVTENPGTNFFMIPQVYSPPNWQVEIIATDTSNAFSPAFQNDSTVFYLGNEPWQAKYGFDVNPNYLPLCP